jgi:RNA polymerase sigma-70 factor (ECF subfamily)
MNQILPIYSERESTLKVEGDNDQTKVVDLNYLMSRVLAKQDLFAFEKLYHFYYMPLLSFCSKFIKDECIAEELVNDVFLKIWTNKNNIVISSSAKGYLFTSVRNIAFDYLRKTKHENFTDLSEVQQQICNTAATDTVIDNTQLTEVLERATEALPRQCKLIFKMSREEGLKYHEIASKLSISIKTVETQISRALKIIRTKILVYEKTYQPYL